jgi:hypothetical protein
MHGVSIERFPNFSLENLQNGIHCNGEEDTIYACEVHYVGKCGDPD